MNFTLSPVQLILVTTVIPTVTFLLGFVLTSYSKRQQLFHYAYVDLDTTDIDEVFKHFRWNPHLEIRKIPPLEYTDKNGAVQVFPGYIRVSREYFSFIETDGSTLKYLEDLMKEKGFKITEKGNY